MRKYLLFAFGLIILSLNAQDFKATRFVIDKVGIVNPMEMEPDYNAAIKHLEMPSPGGSSYKDFLMRQKIKSRAMFPLRENTTTNKTQGTADKPIVGRQTETFRVLPNGVVRTLSGGIPNDNTVAISNDGILISGFNRDIWAYNYNSDTLHFPFSIISLKKMAGDNSITNFFFDPKLIYDPVADRFILTFLRNSNPANNRIFVCFSSTNDPNDSWYVYSLPGNPLNNNRWTDYPAVSITDKDFFITGNLIVPGTTWQIGFDGSVIWQINKEDGYNNAAQLSTTLYSQIKHDGNYTRNIHPVRGANGIAETQYFLSNRNFDLTNDTIFVMHLTGNQSDTTTKLIVDYGVTNTPYGFPPNGQQEDTHVNNPLTGLQTNDARVLGAFLLKDKIQFVANTVNPATGRTAIYHGFVTNPSSSSPKVTGTIIGSDTLDYGYPNIAFTGKEDSEAQAIIGFDFSSIKDNAGVGAIYFNNNFNYSELQILKLGESFIDRLDTPNYHKAWERWGDYFGIQRKFNSPGAVYTTGFYARDNHTNNIWVSELFSPDTNAVCGGGAISNNNLIYPNPTGINEDINIQFNLDKAQDISVYIYDLNGKMVNKILEYKDCVGTNVLTFSVYPLPSGTYIVKILNQDGEQILSEKFIKV